MADIDPNLRVDDFDYDLPAELIAQEPPAERDGGRLLVVNRTTGTLQDRHITDFPTLLNAGDLLVVNNTRVLAARLHGRRSTGGKVELLLLHRLEPGLWEALGKPARHLQPGTRFLLVSRDGSTEVAAEVDQSLGEGRLIVRLDEAIERHLDDFGEAPLPPYIRHAVADSERYQTVFGHVPGSAAAPTAGLHLSSRLLQELKQRGVRVAEVTLQIGLDTFRPVTVERVVEHQMHSEWCAVPPETAALIHETRSAGNRIVVVGTTSARTLESWATAGEQSVSGWSSWTQVFITPGYQWRVVDAMLTNFHLPRSTLLMMISSLAGRELTRRAYEHAIAGRYRFFSFGDAMLIV